MPESPTPSPRMKAWFDRAERPMLALAALAVGMYLAELRGVWAALGIQRPYQIVAFAVDLVFVVDVVLKALVLRRAYLRSPWFIIDLISALPALSALSSVPNPLQGLRFVRAFRMFRVLRSLRSLRILRSLPGLKPLRSVVEEVQTPQSKAYERALLASVLVYAAIFLSLLGWVRSHTLPGQVISVAGAPVSTDAPVDVRVRDTSGEFVVQMRPDDLFQDVYKVEFYLVLGSLFGMMLILVVVRFQIPDLSSRQMRDLLNVALPFQVAEHFIRHPEFYDRTVSMPATIIFCDIEGFTKTVEALRGDLDAVKHNLEAAMDAVVEVHRRHDLIVDKFIGDAIMSFRGGDLVDGGPGEHARRVVSAVIGGDRALRALNNPYFARMKVGCASAEAALIGTFGTSNRLSYTILGDRVNLAARLEASCKAVGVPNLFCDRTRQLCGELEGVAWRRVGLLRVAGKSETLPVWQALDAQEEPDLGWVARYEAGLEAVARRAFDEAERDFQAVIAARPQGDGPSALHLEMCQQWRVALPDEDWQPVIETRK